MLKKSIQSIGVIILLLTVFSNLHGQIGKASITITDSKLPIGKTLCLKCFQNGSFLLMDSAVITPTNQKEIIFDFGAYIGTCELSLWGQQGLGAEFIANPQEQNLRIISSIKDIENGVLTILNSDENRLYRELQAVRNHFDTRISSLLKQKRVLTPLQADYMRSFVAIDKQLDAIKDSINIACDNVTAAYPSLFVHQITRNLIKLTTRKNHPNGMEYDTHDAFQHQHYFDFFEFENPLLIHHYAINYLIEQYFSQFSSTKDKILYASCDLLMQKAQANAEVRNYIYNFLLNYGLSRNLEYMVTYMQENYGDDCDLGVDFDKSLLLKAVNDTKVGAIAPDILLYDANNNPQSLRKYVQQNAYTVLVFWVSWCAHCQKELPKIASYEQNWAKKGIGLFTVSIDEQKDIWVSALKKYGFIGPSVAELTPIKLSKILPTYNIHTTPALFILDKDGKIIAKDIYGETLQTTLANLTR